MIGENGAGKSTLMKILAGVQPADPGELLVDGQPVQIDGVEEALAAGIALIHQELNLADNLDIAAKTSSGGREPRRGPAGVLIDHARTHGQSRRFLDRVWPGRRPGNDRVGTDHWTAADGRDRQGAVG
ncbi:MAG: hypothetical protein Ct9H300mP1_23530 [Planctomycetaceae bacterium]|nr:MAG: hypothetical protein Ct9H300mP1_23530 [Planctomycetaceae bacterium]